MKRRNFIAATTLMTGLAFFGLGAEAGLENIGHEAGIAAEHWGDKEYVKPAEDSAKGDELTRQTYLYFGAMMVSFAFAAQQRIKQSNLEIAAETRDLVEDLVAQQPITERAIGDLALASEFGAMALEQFPATYPPIPELPEYVPATPEPRWAQVIQLPRRVYAPDPNSRGVA
ncbi:MAG TPA: hypothetical protein VM124_03790 [Candidatus Limnocylindrales bacterium]|nr:hypothetical protein [Candidatus Limnocylindrales bacterium]